MENMPHYLCNIMKKLTHRILMLSIIGFMYVLTVHTVLAIEYPYSFSLDPPVSHFIVKPDFKSIGTNFTISNAKDPVYVQVQIVQQRDFALTLYDMDTESIHALDPQHSTFLLLPNSSKRFRVEISQTSSLIELKDYIIDVGVVFKLIQLPKNTQKPIVIEPKVHKYVVLSVTKDGSMSLDPKIALFQNVNGSVALLDSPQHLVATVQNRGNHMLSTHGTVTIHGPHNFKETYTISPTYILANSQKNLSVEGQNIGSFIPLPFKKLSTGQYTASIDLIIPGTNTPRLYGHTNFWLISPFYIIASTIFCLIIILILFILGIRHT